MASVAFSTIHTLALGSVAALALVAPAKAQDAAGGLDPAPEAETQEGENGAIVITARRREESLLDVPIAVTAYSGEALERSGAIDITDVSQSTPNVTLEASRGTNSTLTAFIRGVGQQDPVAGYESGVGIYLDDVYLNRPQGAVLDIYDVERIEVLRGPQGTLYGRNTIGGAVKYVSRRLGSQPRVDLGFTYGMYDQRDLTATLALPVSDQVSVGYSVASLKRDGFGINRTTGEDNYDKDILATRASLEYDNGDFFMRFAGDYTLDRSNPRGGSRLIPGLFSGAQPERDPYDTAGGLTVPEQKVEGLGFSSLLEFTLGDPWTFKMIGAYREDKSTTPIDFDALETVDFDVPAIYENDQFSIEGQLLYEGDRLQGVFGAYYLEANAYNTFDVLLFDLGALFSLPGFTANTTGDVDTETWAVFGDVTYDITDQIAVSVGGRYTNDYRNAVVRKSQLLFGPSAPLGGAAPFEFNVTSDFEGDETFTKFTPRASISYEPNDDHLLYASYSQGFKGGGFDPRAESPQAGDIDGDGTVSPDEVFEFFLFEPETVDSYEVGYKGSLLGNRLNLAIAGFYADYTDVQVPGSVGCIVGGVPTFCGVTTNAGAASFKGIETEFAAILARNFAMPGGRLGLSGALGYLDAQYDEFITNINATPTDVASFRRIQNTPKWTASGTLSYDAPVGGGDLFMSATAAHRSKTFQFETPSPYLDQEAYTLFDANISYASDDGWSIGLHGRNLFNKQYIVSGYQFLLVDATTGDPFLDPVTNLPSSSLGLEGVATAYYGNPQQIFVKLGYSF